MKETSRANADAPVFTNRAVKRVHAIEDEVEQHLLQVHSVAAHERHVVLHVDHVKLYLPHRGVGSHEDSDVVKQLADTERPRLQIVPFEQRAHAVDHGARALVVLMDVDNDRADFVEVRRWILQESAPARDMPTRSWPR